MSKVPDGSPRWIPKRVWSEKPEWIPDQLWLDWELHRNGLKRRLTDQARRRQWKKLEDFRVRGGEEWALQAIEQSILNGWQGIFEPKTPPQSVQQQVGARPVRERFDIVVEYTGQLVFKRRKVVVYSDGREKPVGYSQAMNLESFLLNGIPGSDFAKLKAEVLESLRRAEVKFLAQSGHQTYQPEPKEEAISDKDRIAMEPLEKKLSPEFMQRIRKLRGEDND